LTAAVSANSSYLSDADKLGKVILQALGVDGRSGAARQAVQKFARKFALRFLPWTAAVMVSHALGTGPVPTFSPPHVPAGPVVNGWVLKAPPHLTATKF
jgi:hypothetical protein